MKTITEADKKELYAYIFGIIRNHKCHLLIMNGTANHIHMLVDVNSSISLVNLVKDIKQSSSYWIKMNGKYPKFRSWGEGYYAFSVGISEIDNVKEYIINQENHHTIHSMVDEMKYLADRYSVAWHPDDWK